MAWDLETDVLVVGSGAAGLSAAITAKEAGLATLVVESTDRWGGTTAMSGGGLWMPTNPFVPEDSVEKALLYMDTVIGDVGPASSPERRRAFVTAVPRVFELFARLGLKWTPSKDYPDYYPDQPGGMVGRAIEVEPFDVELLGEWFEKSRVIAEDLPAIPIKTDDVWLVSRAWSTRGGFVRTVRVVFRALRGLLTGKRLYGLGPALASSLMLIVRKQGTEVLLDTPLRELIVEDGAVVGAIVGDGKRVRAKRGVVLAAGGFAQNRAWRERYHGIPGFSSASPGDQGSGIAAAESVGAQLALMDDAWWGSSLRMPTGKYAFLVWERSFPFSIVVDGKGDRFTNESASYIDFGHAILERREVAPTIPCWLILDRRHRRRYLFSALLDDEKGLKDAGAVVVADSLDELAARLEMDPARLRATVERFNGFAKTGVDLDFDRGRTLYDRYYGDPTNEPNPNLGPIEKGPFTAVQIHVGDLGTKGGLLTDADARVLDTSGRAIPGLYAAGNTTASVMGRTYPGPGATIAPAMVFGYLAAQHAASRALPTGADFAQGSVSRLPA